MSLAAFVKAQDIDDDELNDCQTEENVLKTFNENQEGGKPNPLLDELEARRILRKLTEGARCNKASCGRANDGVASCGCRIHKAAVVVRSCSIPSCSRNNAGDAIRGAHARRWRANRSHLFLQFEVRRAADVVASPCPNKFALTLRCGVAC